MSGDSNVSAGNTPQAKRELLEKLLREKAAQNQSASSETQPIVTNASSVRSRIGHADRSRDSFPLSFAQRRMWLLDQLEPGNPAYNLAVSIRLRGNLRMDALVDSIAEVIRRHESLRTTFIMVNDQPAQIIHPPYRLPVSVEAIPLGEERELQQAILKETSRSFDLLNGPLMRATVLELGDTDHVCVFTFHHIISDGWSILVFVRELQALYRSSVSKQASPLADLPVQYVDFADWQERWLQGDVLEAQLDYWKKQLAAPLPVLNLSTDYVRPKVQTFNGARVTAQLSESLSSALKELSRKEGCTLFMTLLAAFSALLYRHTGQSDLTIGSPIAGRSRTELEGLIGFFLNTLVMRVHLDDSPTFHELIQRVREVALQAYANQDVPFEKLLEELHPERHLNRTPVFQVFFNMLNFNEGLLDFADLRSEYLAQPDTEARFDLTLYVREENKRITLVFVYNTDLFSHERILELGSQMQMLLEQIVEYPERSIEEYSLFTPQARAVLPDPTLTLDEPEQVLLPAWILRWATETPDAIAIEKAESKWTYRELEARAVLLAQELICRGVQPGDAVALSGSRSFDLIAGMLAIFKSGGVLLTVDSGLPAKRKRLMLEQASTKAVVYAGNIDSVDLSWADALDPQNILALPEASESEHDRSNTKRASLPPLTGNDPAYIFFTSGTTGVPKGVLGNHKGLGHFLNWQRETFEVRPGDRAAQLTGLSFDVILRDVFVALVSGATLCLPDDNIQLDAEATLHWMKESDITIVHTVPTLAHTWVSSATAVDLPDLRYIFFAGEPLQASLIEKWRSSVPHGQIVNLYGPTETTMAKCFYPVPERPLPSTQPVGRPLPQTQVFVVGRHGQLCGLGEPGEIVIRTPFRTRGYLNEQRENDRGFVTNPFGTDQQDKVYFTGDQGRFRPDGVLEILGRNDDQIKIRGLRVELAEIENALARHPAVRQAVVIAWQGPENDKRLVAYIVPSTVQFPHVHELIGYLQQDLPSYMIPAHFMLIDALPFTANGKVNKRELPDPDVQSARTAVFVAPQTQLQELVAEIWADVLKLEKVGIRDNFFELGGHSLLATQIMSRIRRMIHVELPLRVLFEFPTIAGIAAAIESIRNESALQVPPLKPVPRDKPPALSFSQERMWFMHQLAPESAAYNMSSSMRIQGELNIPVLQQAINIMVLRHEILRTSFRLIDGVPAQIIASPTALEIPLVDLGDVDPDDRENQAHQLIRTNIRTPFDLANGPLLRLLVIRLGEQDHILAVCLHHIISDQWSNGVFLAEFAAIYNARCAGSPLTLSDLPIQYADYSVWQRGWLTGDILQSRLAFWKKQLDGLSALDFPTDFPRPAMMTYNGAVARLPLSATTIHAIRNLCRQEHVTPFMFFLGVFKVLLLRYTGQQDLAIGSPIANRNWFEVEPLIGTFVNTVVLRTLVEGNPTFKNFLGTIRDVSLDAFNHQDLPFEKLIEELQPKRDLSRAPLVQVLFNVQNAPVTMPQLHHDPVLTPLWLDGVAAQFDLTLSITTDIVPTMVVTYNTDLFKQETIAGMLGHIESLMNHALADPDGRVLDLEMLTPAERQRQLLTWNETGRDYPRSSSVHELVEHQAHRTPDAIAIRFMDQQLTYRELNSRANQLAHQLRGLGVTTETTVGISMERSAEMIVGLLGILKAGGTYIPLDPMFPHDRLEYMLEFSETRYLVTHNQPRAKATVDQLRKDGLIVVNLDDDWHMISNCSEEDLQLNVAPEQLVYIIYTSGSTGRPKGVQIPHRAVVNFLTSMKETPGLSPDDRLLSVTTLSFDISVLEIFLPLITGACVVVLPGEAVYDASALIRHLGTSDVTVMQATPATWKMIIDAGWTGDKSLKVLCGGEAMPKELARWLTQHVGSVWNMYGPTETTVWSTISEILPTSDVITIGRPIANTRIYILDNNMQPVPANVAGELFIAGDGVARGYLKQPELTAEKFVPEPFTSGAQDLMYKTGDQARYLSDGRIDFLGRADFQVKVRGYRIELGEIETVLGEHPGVRQAVVMAREDTPGDQRLVAYVILEAGVRNDTAELRQFIRERLPDYMVPSTYVFLDEFPLTPNRKVNRKALPAPDATQTSQARGLVLPRSHIEAKLVNIWEDLLKTRPISVDDNFFDLGGHSLLATQLFARIKDEFNANLPLATLFRESTVESVARIIQQESNSAIWSSLIEMQPQGKHHPFYCVHGLTGDILWFRELAQCLAPEYPFYGLQSRGLDGVQHPIQEIEQMAAHYVAELRRLQPKGPYYLGGASFGGTVALEMAQQLRALGEEVSLLVIFDAAPANVGIDANSPGLAQRLRVMHRIIGNFPNWFKEFTRMTPSQMLMRIRRNLRLMQKTKNRFETETVRRLDSEDLIDFASELSVHRQELITINYQAMMKYVPKPYSGNVLLLKAVNRPLFSTFDPELSWQKLAPGRVKLFHVPGSHEGMFKKPSVEELARILKAYLDDADR